MIVKKIMNRLDNYCYKSISYMHKMISKKLYKHFYNYPFGRNPRASAEEYRELWNQSKKKEYSVIDSYEAESGYAIEKDWFEELALLTQVVIKKTELCYQHGRILYTALSNYIAYSDDKFINIMETGTARGFSALCMAKALSDANQPGKIVTFDVLPHNVKFYWNCIADLEEPKTRAELLEAYSGLINNNVIFVQGDTMHELEKIHLPRVQFAFLDGNHTYDALIHEFAYLKEKQVKGDIIIFDDYTSKLYPGVVDAVDEICEKNDYAKKIVSICDERRYAIATKQ